MFLKWRTDMSLFVCSGALDVGTAIAEALRLSCTAQRILDFLSIGHTAFTRCSGSRNAIANELCCDFVDLNSAVLEST